MCVATKGVSEVGAYARRDIAFIAFVVGLILKEYEFVGFVVG
jgi:hypothetical protein